MSEEEVIVENIINRALSNGMRISYGSAELSEYKPFVLRKINSMLEQYGKLKDDSWYEFMADERGDKFIVDGGFAGKRRREAEDKELKEMQLEITRLQKFNLQLQNNELSYNKRTRWISWIALLFGVIGTIVALFK